MLDSFYKKYIIYIDILKCRVSNGMSIIPVLSLREKYINLSIILNSSFQISKLIITDSSDKTS